MEKEREYIEDDNNIVNPLSLLGMPAEIQENILEKYIISIIENNRDLTPFQIIGRIAYGLLSLKGTSRELYERVAVYIHSNYSKHILRSVLISNGIDINRLNKYGDTTLLSVINLSRGKLDMVKFLIDVGADVNIQGQYGDTALIWAAIKGYAGIVKLLIVAGADVSIKNKDGNTALSEATRKNHKGIAKLLIDAGAQYHN